MSNILEVMGATAGALALLDRLQENPQMNEKWVLAPELVRGKGWRVVLKTGNKKKGTLRVRPVTEPIYTLHQAQTFIDNNSPSEFLKNPRGRSKRSVTRLSQTNKRKPTKRLIERRKKTLRAPRGFFANPAQSFPFVVEQQRAGSPSWRIVAAFKSRPEADAYSKALFRSDPYRGVRRRRLDKLVQRT